MLANPNLWIQNGVYLPKQIVSFSFFFPLFFSSVLVTYHKIPVH